MTTTTMERTVTVDPFAHIEYVDPCPGMKGEDIVVEDCAKCSGTGSVSWGVDVDGEVTLRNKDGQVVSRRIVPKVCFDCNGVGRFGRKVKNIRAAARRQIKAYNESMDAQRAFIEGAEQREAEEAARLEAFRAEHADLAAALDALGEDYFAQSLTEQVKEGKALSTKQADALRAAGAKEAAKAEQTWLGEEGEVVTFEASVEDVKVFDGYSYGSVSYLFILRTTDGNKVTVYTSAQFMFDLRDSGETMRLTATVKAQKEYQGAKETQVARIKKAK